MQRIIPDTLELSAGISKSDVDIPVVGEAFTNDPAHYPMNIMIRGELITANGFGGMEFKNCTRAVNAVEKSHPTGAKVELADPFRLSPGYAGVG